jgi:hypothetical protein
VSPRDMVCLRNISVDTLHKGDTEDDDDDDDDDNNNNSIMINILLILNKTVNFLLLKIIYDTL